jgi:Ring finger domain
MFVVKHDTWMSIELDDKECIICMDNKEHEWLPLECQHTYHKKCIHKWMRIRMTCPICVRAIAPSYAEEIQLIVHHDSDDALHTFYESRQRETSYILCGLLIIAIICIVIGGFVFVYG